MEFLQPHGERPPLVVSICPTHRWIGDLRQKAARDHSNESSNKLSESSVYNGFSSNGTSGAEALEAKLRPLRQDLDSPGGPLRKGLDYFLG